MTGGLVVGVLDLTYAIVVYSPRAPILIPQTIASGILGAKSYHGGIPTAVFGVFLHFFIALCVATAYYVASRKLSFLITNAVPSGLIYGGLVYCVMHGLVLPLSAVAHGITPRAYVVTEFVEHWFFVGLPVALSVRYFSGAPLQNIATKPSGARSVG
jgi:uncharacterized membrane protein YagU involved in acid resistance